MKTIGFGSQLANGKDTAADMLQAKLNEPSDKPHRWTRNAFANAVKKTFQDAFGVDRDFIERWKRESTPPPGFDLPIRDCLIKIGDGFRKMKANIWIEIAFRSKENQIISDCRYVNEAKYIRANGGITILMWRPGFENNIDNASEQEFTPYIRYLRDIKWRDGTIPQDWEVHKSYWRKKRGFWTDWFMNYNNNYPLDRRIPFDLWLKNDGTKDDLEAKINKIIVPYIKERLMKPVVV